MKPKSVKKVESLAKELGIKYELIPHSESGKTTNDAQKVLGIPKKNILKTLLLKSNGSYLAVILSGERMLDFDKLKKLTGYEEIKMAKKEEIEKVTGYKSGGLPPIVFKDLCTTYVDDRVMTKEYVVGAGGSEYYGFKISPKEFLKLGCTILSIS